MRQCMDSENLHQRLKRVIRRVQAIDRMIDEDVPCEDVLAQINAAKSALHGCSESCWRAYSPLRARRHRAQRRGQDDQLTKALLQTCPLYETLWNAHIASRDSAEGGANHV